MSHLMVKIAIKKANNTNLSTKYVACSCKSNKVSNRCVVNASVNQTYLMTLIKLDFFLAKEVACSCKSHFVIPIKLENYQSFPSACKVSPCDSSFLLQKILMTSQTAYLKCFARQFMNSIIKEFMNTCMAKVQKMKFYLS